MNAERLHAIAIVLNAEMNKTNIVAKVEDLVNVLDSLVKQPQASHQQTLAKNLETLYATLTNTTSDSFSPAWRQQLIEMGGEKMFGGLLKSEVESIFGRNQITPAVALEELQQLCSRLQSFKTASISSSQHSASSESEMKSCHLDNVRSGCLF